MRFPPVGPELRELLAGGEEGHGRLRELLANYHPNEAAELLTALEPDEITEAMSLLDIETERDLFAYFEPDLQERIMLGSSRSRVRKLLEEMPSDERAEFLDTLDDSVRQQLMPLLAREARLDVLRREQFADDQVGSIMSTEFCVLGEELTMPRAIQEIRRQAPSKETIYYSYVLNRDGKLKGFISLRNLIVSDPKLTVGEVMKTEVVSVDVDADQEDAAAKIREYDLLALPVVDSGHHMVGIITHDDAFDIIAEETTEDIKMIAGITVTEDDPDDYLSTSVWGHFRGRVAWLTFLAISFLGVAWILGLYEDTIKNHKIVMAFLPLLLATGANVGGQASALVLRELAVNERFDHDALVRVVWKELRIGLILCLTLGSVVFGLTAVFSLTAGEPFNPAMCGAIAGAVGAHVVTAAVMGSMIPMFISRTGMRPEVFSHPALNFVADTGGTLIYVAIIATVVLPAGA